MNTEGRPLLPLSGIAVDHPAGGFIRPYQRELALVGRVADLFWVVVALRVSLGLAGWEWGERYTLLSTIACVVFYISAEAFNVYNDRRSAPLRFDVAHLLGAWMTSAFILLLIGYALKVSDLYSRLAVAGWFVLAPATLVAWRAVTRAGLTKARALGYNSRRVAIVGAGRHGLRLAETITRAPWMGFHLTGIFDDRSATGGRLPASLPCQVLGTTRDLQRQVAEHRIDIVYVALPVNNVERITNVVQTLADTTVSLYFVPDMFLFSMLNGRWVRIGELPAVSVFETPFYGINGWIKRGEDVVIASLVLAISAIPMLLVAAAIKLTSSGPVLFRQRRYGLDGREFRMLKFRTMTVCEDDHQLTQAIRNDARVTWLGRLLRRTSLDELPQFFNVIGGSMSVVGPRPHATAHNEHYRRLVKHYMVRHKVRPGISGWAQANGWRGETETLGKMEARVEHDLWYLRNWSVLLDIRIIAMTLVRLWRDTNVY